MNIELLALFVIMCEVLDQQEVGRKFNLQTKEASGNTESKIKSTSTSNIDSANNCINIPDYFRSSTNKKADKRVSRQPMMKIHYAFSDFV